MTGLFKILIVDDDADYRETYKMLLSKKGYNIETSASAEEAFKIMEKEYYPLIISDIMMPGTSGIKFLKEVKELYDKNIEVIMVTGYGSIETAVQAMKIGAFGYFIKSHNPEELILEIEKVHKIFSLLNTNKINKSNKNIHKAVGDGTFREDLLYRINTIEINIPPLRQRKEDLEDMIYFFINMFNKEMSKGIKDIEEETKSYLLNYNYPGNIRELKNIIERMVVLSNDGILRRNITNEKNETKALLSKDNVVSYKEARKNFEINYLIHVLKSCNNNITHAADLVGMSRRQLFNKITEYQIKDYLE